MKDSLLGITTTTIISVQSQKTVAVPFRADREFLNYSAFSVSEAATLFT
jgi:hypothetical protein